MPNTIGDDDYEGYDFEVNVVEGNPPPMGNERFLNLLHALSDGSLFPIVVVFKPNTEPPDPYRPNFVAVLSTENMGERSIERSQVHVNPLYRCPLEWEGESMIAVQNGEAVIDSIRVQACVYLSQMPLSNGTERRLTIDRTCRVGLMEVRLRPSSFLLWGTRFMTFGPPPAGATGIRPLTQAQWNLFLAWSRRNILESQVYLGGLACSASEESLIRHFSANLALVAVSYQRSVDTCRLGITSWFRGTGVIPHKDVSFLKWKPLNLASSELDPAVRALIFWIHCLRDTRNAEEANLSNGLPIRPVRLIYHSLQSVEEIVRNELAFLWNPRTRSWVWLDSTLEYVRGEWEGEPAGEDGVVFADHRRISYIARARAENPGVGVADIRGFLDIPEPVSVTLPPLRQSAGTVSMSSETPVARMRGSASSPIAHVISRPPAVDVSEVLRREASTVRRHRSLSERPVRVSLEGDTSSENADDVD